MALETRNQVEIAAARLRAADRQRDIISAARAKIDTLRETLGKLSETDAKSARTLLKSIEGPLNDLEALHGTAPRPVLDKINAGIKTPLELHAARAKIELDLVKAMENAEKPAGHLYAKANRPAPSQWIEPDGGGVGHAGDGMETATKTESSIAGWLGRAFEKHQNWIHGKSSGARLGFSVGEIAVGSVVSQIGAEWIAQGIGGQRNARMRDDSGATIIVTRPINVGERATKIVAGAAAVGVGIAGIGIGLTNAFTHR